MKGLFFIIIAFVVSPSTWASCPQLEGDYLCESTTKVAEKMNITQELRNGVTHYLIETDSDFDQLIADGQPRPLNKDGFRRGSRRVLCDHNELMVSMAGEIWDGNNKLGRAALLATIAKDDSGNLQQRVEGTLVVDGKGVIPVDERSSCEKQ